MNIGVAIMYALLIFGIVVATLGSLALIITAFKYVSDRVLSRRKDK